MVILRDIKQGSLRSLRMMPKIQGILKKTVTFYINKVTRYKNIRYF